MNFNAYFQLSQYPTHYKVSDQTETENNGHDVDINFEFPWGSQPVESIANHGDKPLISAQENTGENCQVRYLQANLRKKGSVTLLLKFF